MRTLSEADLAHAAGVDVAYVRRLVDLGILDDHGGASPFVEGDLRRVRLVAACEQAGLPLEGIAKTMAAGQLTLTTLDLPHYDRWEGHGDTTLAQAAASIGMPESFLQDAIEALGFAAPAPEDRLRLADMEMLPVLQLALGVGIGHEAAIRMLRVYGDNLRRIGQAEAHMYHVAIEEPLRRAGLDQATLLEQGGVFGEQVMPLLDRAVMAMYRRQQERAWMEDLIEHVEAALEEGGIRERVVRPPAMAFIDLVGYTRLTEEFGDSVAAEYAATFGAVAQRAAADHGGRAVKWLGDGVMCYFKEPPAAVRAALRLAGDTPEAGLPQAHVGVHAGPVVFQDGDYYGRTVNLASRVSGRAGAGEVLVTRAVVDEAAGAQDLAFEAAGAAEIKGVVEPVELFRAALR